MPSKNNLYNYLKSGYFIDETSNFNDLKGVKKEEVLKNCAISSQEFEEVF